MIHNWADDFHVRPDLVLLLKKVQHLLITNVLLKPVKSVQMFPSANLTGMNAKAQFNSLLYGKRLLH